jgi:hypothetical protein
MFSPLAHGGGNGATPLGELKSLRLPAAGFAVTAHANTAVESGAAPAAGSGREGASTSSDASKRVASWRVKYRFSAAGQGKRTKVRLPPWQVGFHPNNRNGLGPQPDRTEALLVEIAGCFDKEELTALCIYTERCLYICIYIYIYIYIYVYVSIYLYIYIYIYI